MIGISTVDFILHVALAIWVRGRGEADGEQPYFWLALVFALVANLLSIVIYIARCVMSWFDARKLGGRVRFWC